MLTCRVDGFGLVQNPCSILNINGMAWSLLLLYLADTHSCGMFIFRESLLGDTAAENYNKVLTGNVQLFTRSMQVLAEMSFAALRLCTCMYTNVCM